MKRLLAALLFVLPASASAEMYRYSDSSGVVHYVDDLQKVPKKYRKGVVETGSLPVIVSEPPVSPSRKRPPAEVRQESSEEVEIFVTSWCGYCRRLESFLQERGIRYAKRDIENDPAAEAAFNKLGGRGVPLTRIGSTLISGYNPDRVLSRLREGK